MTDSNSPHTPLQENRPGPEPSSQIDSLKTDDSNSQHTVVSTYRDGHGTEAIKTAVGGEEEGHVHGLELVLVTIGLCMAVLLLALDTSILATAIPTITTRFHSIHDVGWYGSAYLLAACSFQPLSGKLYSQYPMKLCFLLSLCIFEIGSLVCATAQSSNSLIVGRAISGMGSTGLFSGAITIIAVIVPLANRAPYMSLISSMHGIATIAGPLLGGALTDHVSWRWCFYINLPCGAITVVVIYFVLHLPPRPKKTNTLGEQLTALDLVGCALFIPFIVMVLLAMQWGGTKYAWDSGTVLGLLIGSLPLLAIFLVHEHRRGDTAMIPLQILMKRTVILSCLTIALHMGGLLVTTYYLPIWYQVVKGASPTMSGVMGLPLILSQTISALAAGILVGRIGYYSPFMLLGSALSAIGSGLLSTLTPHTPTGVWIGYLILSGFGRGMVLQMPLLAIQSVLPLAQVPVGSAIGIFFNFFGGTLVLTFGQTCFSNRLPLALLKYAGSGIDVKAVLAAGAVAAKGMGAGVANAYNHAVTETLYVTVGASCLAFVVSAGIEWRSVKKVGVEKSLDEEKA